jgi:hypothetical protein
VRDFGNRAETVVQLFITNQVAAESPGDCWLRVLNESWELEMGPYIWVASNSRSRQLVHKSRGDDWISEKEFEHET